MIYFDNSATTKPYPEVIEAFAKVSSEYFGNPSSLHGMGARSEKLLSQARKQVADLLGAAPSEVYFTSGGTEGNNLAVKGAAEANAKRGKHIITTEIEHASVKDACRYLEGKGFEVTYLPVNEDGLISLLDLKEALRSDTILVSIMHVNNEVGSIQPIEEIGRIVSGYPQTLFHVDHVQGIGKTMLNLTSSHIDLCTISGHKFHALKGTGVLYKRNGVNISPLFSGGSQESKVRSGTENVAGIVALAKALRLTLQHREKDGDKLLEIRDCLYSGLKEMDAVLMNSTLNGAPHIINFSIPGIKSEVFIHALEAKDIFVSTTSACSSKNKSASETVMNMFRNKARAESVVRISLSYQNDIKEAKEVLDAIRATIEKLQMVMG
ncbi:cysteine desulfurase family protein [Peribacillus sp. B-H-3]|uniref:cysteine desulfurase family protein n=1 Tax=Peribacillus sp. B-H-3 TaxID=3400420 RepID=UPI003B013E49